MSADSPLAPMTEEIYYLEVVDDDFSQPDNEESIVEIVDISNEETKIEDESSQEATTSNKLPLVPLCNVCNGSYKYLARHLQSHGPFNCIECLLNFPTQSEYDGHLETAHNAQSYTCTWCHMGFPSLKELAVHNFEHTGTYSCPKCKFTVKGKHKHSLILHIRRHAGQFNYHCDICKQGFMNKNFLASHIEMHEGIPKYKCEICQKKFTVKRYLNVHMKLNHKMELHGIDEIYQCDVCGRKFSFKKSLVRHLSLLHKIGKDVRVECQVCHMKLGSNHNLKKHMRTHTGETRFCCDTCGKGFAEKRYLDKHQEAHKREKQLKMDLKTTLNEHLNFASSSDHCTV